MKQWRTLFAGRPPKAHNQSQPHRSTCIDARVPRRGQKGCFQEVENAKLGASATSSLVSPLFSKKASPWTVEGLHPRASHQNKVARPLGLRSARSFQTAPSLLFCCAARRHLLIRQKPNLWKCCSDLLVTAVNSATPARAKLQLRLALPAATFAKASARARLRGGTSFHRENAGAHCGRKAKPSVKGL